MASGIGGADMAMPFTYARAPNLAHGAVARDGGEGLRNGARKGYDL